MNTKNRRAIAPLAVTAAAALALAGCAGGDGGGEAVEGDFSGVTLEVSAAWSGAEQENFELVLDKFEADTGATVNYTSFGDKAATTLGTQIEGGNPPDVAVLAQPALLQSLAADGNLAALSTTLSPP